MTYTSHGHWIGPGEPAIPRPLMARCGGLLVCPQCRSEAAIALAAWMSKPGWHNETQTGAGVITAKIRCDSKTETGEGDGRQALVTFTPDYTDDRNKEWSRFTPHLALSMTLAGHAADLFEQGKNYTLQFVENED